MRGSRFVLFFFISYGINICKLYIECLNVIYELLNIGSIVWIIIGIINKFMYEWISFRIDYSIRYFEILYSVFRWYWDNMFMFYFVGLL